MKIATYVTWVIYVGNVIFPAEVDEDDDEDGDYDEDMGDVIEEIDPGRGENVNYNDIDGPTAQDIDAKRRKQDMFFK